MASNLTVLVKNISADASDNEVRDFFSFCGKITEIKVTPGEGNTKDASVTFEKETAAKTAQLLNNTQLKGSQISVIPADGQVDDGTPHTTNADRDTDEITQEEKPRSRILAEYLAHGYVVGDAALQRAIELDHTHGRYQPFHEHLNEPRPEVPRYRTPLVAASARTSRKRQAPLWQELVKFYTEGQRQVQDIHAEARRLADLKKEEHGGSAYKASGLERVFGKEKAQTAQPTSSGNASAATDPFPAPGPKAGTEESTPLSTTGPIPSKVPGDEKA
ncbi:Protein vip1 [Daldinia childiae]|uniref:Protein vip1 n=1 Tax=Daldinia childiae TaxID=326645 RepID=UPI0014482A62|nr:Protein vip1 [Daldinia childiae]KAF3062299.1 Protein vip1 [Daldinia childiae]